MQYRLSTIFLVFFVVAATLALFGTWGLLVGPVFLIIALLYNWKARLKITFVELMIVASVVLLMMALFLPALPSFSSYRKCVRNLKCLGMAMHYYHDAQKRFPRIITFDEKGKPLYSWMVALLPFLDHSQEYYPLDISEPWNGPNNSKILQQLRIEEYECPEAPRNAEDYSADYIAIIGPGTIWRSEGVVRFEDLRVPSLTVVAVECIESDKHWAEPYTLTVEEVIERMKTGKGMRISTAHNGYVHILFADGSVRTVMTEMPISIWKKLLVGEIKSHEELDIWEAAPDDPPPVNIWINGSSSFSKWSFFLSILVWLVSLGLLFYRAWKSRTVALERRNSEAGGGLSNP